MFLYLYLSMLKNKVIGKNSLFDENTITIFFPGFEYLSIFLDETWRGMVCHALAWSPFAKIIQGFWSGLVWSGILFLEMSYQFLVWQKWPDLILPRIWPAKIKKKNEKHLPLFSLIFYIKRFVSKLVREGCNFFLIFVKNKINSKLFLWTNNLELDLICKKYFYFFWLKENLKKIKIFF